MRILHVIPSLAPRYGGPSQVVIDLCNQLCKKEVDCDVVTTNADGDSELNVELHSWVNYKGLHCRFFQRQFSESFKYSGPAASWLRNNVKYYDLVHIHGVFSHLSISAAKSCLSEKRPYIIRPLGTLDPWSLSQKPVRKRLFLLLGLKKLIRQAAALQYTTQLEQNQTQTHLGLSNGIVVPNGLTWQDYQVAVDERAFESTFPKIKHGSYLLVLGRLDVKKNIESVLSGFQEIKLDARFEDLQLVISGDGNTEYKNSITQLVRDHPNCNQIHFTGWVQGNEKIMLLAAARLFVLPSLNENFAVSVAESLACGVPAVVSDQVYLSPNIKRSNCGWVCSEPSEFGTTMLKALHSGEISARGVNARQLISDELDWNIVAAGMIRHYQNIIHHA